MTPREEQLEEIKTIKPREFKISLSDADVKRLFEKAYSNGITPEHLIESYLGDLLIGTYTNGSDEVDLASEYFDRCCHGLGLTKSFLQWAFEEYAYDYDALALAVEMTDNADWYSEDELQGPREYITKCYNAYCDVTKQHGDTPQTLEEGIAAIREYEDRLSKALADGESETLEQDEENDEQFDR